MGAACTNVSARSRILQSWILLPQQRACVVAGYRRLLWLQICRVWLDAGVYYAQVTLTDAQHHDQRFGWIRDRRHRLLRRAAGDERGDGDVCREDVSAHRTSGTAGRCGRCRQRTQLLPAGGGRGAVCALLLARTRRVV
jgi:hypothetical protein